MSRRWATSLLVAASTFAVSFVMRSDLIVPTLVLSNLVFFGSGHGGGPIWLANALFMSVSIVVWTLIWYPILFFFCTPLWNFLTSKWSKD